MAKAKKRILIAEDSVHVRELLIKALQLNGYDSMTAEDGLEAIEKIQAGGMDLVLLDITMPKLDGMGALSLIKLDPKIAHVPVLMCTDHSTLSDVEKCCGNGAAGYILKPFELTKVLEKVQSVIKEKKLE